MVDEFEVFVLYGVVVCWVVFGFGEGDGFLVDWFFVVEV